MFTHFSLCLYHCVGSAHALKSLCGAYSLTCLYIYIILVGRCLSYVIGTAHYECRMKTYHACGTYVCIGMCMNVERGILKGCLLVYIYNDYSLLRTICTYIYSTRRRIARFSRGSVYYIYALMPVCMYTKRI